ncbi:metal-sensing transcriptional repressor [Pectinatus haikarae]|uniref:DNA-binding FrmR family transcriptional regulator n=1 Tax=Pectinatus haikarae TaxID=349096 RepID=A0ABT9Y7L6_9FIRM|nr:metal-sensing transcriptional repressor [Pectinatus haikarae]MDQ0203828.1 DNA-binding FrmR family transcriptional regulator [Pectinatus haikarae]
MVCQCNNKNNDGIKYKRRDMEEKKNLMTRLNKIEGQVRGLKAMVDEDRYCVDILIQVSAVQSALNSFNKELLARHIKTCVAEDIRKGNDEAINELCELLKKQMK